MAVKFPNEIDVVERQMSKRKTISDGSWWLEDTKVVHGAIFSTVKNYQQRWSANYLNLNGLFQRYEDKLFFNGYDFNLSQFSKVPGNHTLSLNVTASCIDTLTSKITQHNPSVAYVTNGGDWKEHRQAQDLYKFITGRFQAEKMESYTRDMFNDAAICGTGLLHFKFLKDRVVPDAIKPQEVLFDWVDAQNGNPMDVHLVKLVNKYQLMLEYPDKFEIIRDAPVEDSKYGVILYSKDCVLVVESYNRYARRHVVCLPNGALLDEDWHLEDGKGNCIIPLVIMNYKKSCRSWYGIGIAEELRTIHDELQYMLRVAQEITRLCSVPVLYVPRSAGIIDSQFDNRIGKICYFDGMQIPVSQPMGEPPISLFQQIQNYFSWAYQIAGISEMSAQSESPTHLDSGRAINTMWNIESTRFNSTAKNYQESISSINSMMINMCKYLSKRGVEQKANFYGLKLSQQINFNEVNLDRDQFDIQAYPVDNLPNEPAGRLSYVQDLINMGVVDKPAVQRLLKLPDTEQEAMFESSEYDYVMEQIYQCTQGNPQQIHPNLDIEMAVTIIKKAYFFYKNRSLPDDRLLVLEAFLKSATDQMSSVQAQNQVVQQAVQSIVMQNQQQNLQQQNPGQG